MNHDAQLNLPAVPESLAARIAAGGAVAWSQPVTMRTYEAGAPDEYPLFVNRRVYQGSSGRIYPVPFVDHVEEVPVDRQWRAIHLENRWVRLMVLPELGGRIHVGYDKSADYDFFYRNSVIKPALVGLGGPWISGGVEFNWPQHHRPATYLPVETQIEEHEDGSVTVWCSDHDPFARMRGTHGVRLHPDRAVVEVVVRLHNRTSEAQTFLWWANVAARVHDDYQAFFPTDVDYVADHARRAITAYPKADRPYYGYDYPAHHETGGDRLDFYKNVKVPTSYMVCDTQDDFFGGYDHAAQAGFVHVADRHIAPGKKMWTWGDAAFGHAWDRQLTDSDGPYIELMAGVYTDNQPDFTWLEPGETKTFTQSWFPIQKIGVAHQANAEAAVNLEVTGHHLQAGVAVSRPRPSAVVRITVRGKAICEQQVNLAPDAPFTWSTLLTDDAAPTDARIIVEHDGTTVIDWAPRPRTESAEPWQAVPPPQPAEIESVDELYLTGLHLTQYRHPTRSPIPYWEEGLRRDPGDARCNLALGTERFHRGLYSEAEAYLRRALARLTRYNAQPRDGETSYLLGLTLLRLGNTDAAVDALAKAAWNRAWVAPAAVERARIAARTGHFGEALRLSIEALSCGPDDNRARALQIVALRRLGRPTEADDVIATALAASPLDHTVCALRDGICALSGLDGRTVIDVALDLSRAGDDDGALEALELAARIAPTPAGEFRPLAHYHRAAILDRLGRTQEAVAARLIAQDTPDTLCFPAGLDDQHVLESALSADPTNRQVRCLLAMLYFDAQRGDEALDLWESAIADGETGTVALRNAAIATYSVKADPAGALALYERALAVRPDARLVYEHDQLCARAGVSVVGRVANLDARRDLVLRRDDATVTYCNLLIYVQRLDDAATILDTRRFAPFEGGEGQVLAVWERLNLALSRTSEQEGDLPGAIKAVHDAIAVPEHLGETRHPLADTTEIYTRLATLLDQSGRHDEATAARTQVRGHAIVTPVLDDGSVDYFATSLPDLLLFPPLD
ncbi:DUF5107 domain-containing protein [Xylanimonas allomyrinae]|uniref:DUF5107 domain-containing protein n=1 Tax=Xylanimonas allomyrinae TaxID=2509459 RepID=A0A4P6EP79_9MICO|nr:DUF5107 domain-containing protein [Xylanimonas allomyrinae]QAY64564.1 DUF5107 domain-containing protein [Xylanimonas allomyrinae]